MCPWLHRRAVRGGDWAWGGQGVGGQWGCDTWGQATLGWGSMVLGGRWGQEHRGQGHTGLEADGDGGAQGGGTGVQRTAGGTRG